MDKDFNITPSEAELVYSALMLYSTSAASLAEHLDNQATSAETAEEASERHDKADEWLVGSVHALRLAIRWAAFCAD